MKKARKLGVLSATLALSLAVSGYRSCEVEPLAPEEPARLRVIHLSPDAPPVDVLANGALRAVTELDYKASTSYLELEPDTYDFDVVPAGGDVGDSVLAIPALALDSGEYYTAVAFDRLSGIQALALSDDFSELTSDSFRVRAIHTAAGVGQVDIWNVPAEGAPSPLWVDVDFGAVGGYFDLPVGAYTLGFDVDDDARPDLLFDVPALPAGEVVNAFALADDSGVFLLAQLSDGATARIDAYAPAPPVELGKASLRLFHLSPDAPAVDIFANGAIALVEGASYLDSSARFEVFEGSYDIDIAPAGAGVGASVLSVPGLSLEADGSYTAAAIGALSNLQAIAFGNDLEDISHQKVRVRPIHAATAIGEVDLYLRVSYRTWWGYTYRWIEPLAHDVSFGGVGQEKDIWAGRFDLLVDLDDDGRADAEFALPQLEGGSHANVFVSTDSAGNPNLSFDVQ